MIQKYFDSVVIRGINMSLYESSVFYLHIYMDVQYFIYICLSKKHISYNQDVANMLFR